MISALRKGLIYNVMSYNSIQFFFFRENASHRNKKNPVKSHTVVHRIHCRDKCCNICSTLFCGSLIYLSPFSEFFRKSRQTDQK